MELVKDQPDRGQWVYFGYATKRIWSHFEGHRNDTDMPVRFVYCSLATLIAWIGLLVLWSIVAALAVFWIVLRAVGLGMLLLLPGRHRIRRTLRCRRAYRRGHRRGYKTGLTHSISASDLVDCDE